MLDTSSLLGLDAPTHHDRQVGRCGGQPTLKVLLLTKYSNLGASTRQRLLQFIPALEARGWSVTWKPLFQDSYLRRLYSCGSRSNLQVLESYARRFWNCFITDCRPFDVVVVQQECFPYLPFGLESWLYHRSCKVITDYDDAVFEQYRPFRILRDKISNVMRASWKVVVGSRYLKEYAVRHNGNVTFVPTVVDTRDYQPRADYTVRESSFVIGWIGTPVTARFLREISVPLAKLARRHPIRLRCLGAHPNFGIDGLTVECIPWTQASHAAWIQTFDAGIMPLTDEPFAQGKCGFKLIQYMAGAVPVVASAVGANNDILDDGSTGLLAKTPAEFEDKLELLICDSKRRQRLGRAGRDVVESRYSLQSQLATFCGLFDGAIPS
jgi:glycosyltransferase involved in cell wall biosynthesis